MAAAALKKQVWVVGKSRTDWTSYAASFDVPIVDEKEAIYALHRRLLEQFIAGNEDFNENQKSAIRNRSSLVLVERTSEKAKLVSKIYKGIPYWFNWQPLQIDTVTHILRVEAGDADLGELDASIESMPEPIKLGDWIAESKLSSTDDIVQFVADTHKVWISHEHVLRWLSRQVKNALGKSIEAAQGGLALAKSRVESAARALTNAQAEFNAASKAYKEISIAKK